MPQQRILVLPNHSYFFEVRLSVLMFHLVLGVVDLIDRLLKQPILADVAQTFLQLFESVDLVEFVDVQRHAGFAAFELAGF